MPDQPERQVDEPHDREPEHPEQHPRADRAGRGLPRERGALARVDPQRREQRDLREHPEDVQEALEPLGPARRGPRRTPLARRRRRARGRSGTAVGQRRTTPTAKPCQRQARRRRSSRRGSPRHSEAGQRGQDQRRTSRSTSSAARARAKRSAARGAQHGRGVRIPVCQEQEIRVELSAVAQARDAQVAQALGHASRDDRVEPAEERDARAATPPSAPRGGRPGWRGRAGRAVFQRFCVSRRVDLEVDAVGAGAPGEAREPAADEVEEREQVEHVAHVRGEEAMEPGRHASRDERREPGAESREERRRPTRAAATRSGVSRATA